MKKLTLVTTLIAVSFLFNKAIGQTCSGWSDHGANPACPGVEIQYFLTGGNLVGCSITAITGPASVTLPPAGGGGITWPNVPGQYSIEWTCSSCTGHPYMNVIVDATSVTGGSPASASQTICAGGTPASITVNNYDGNIIGWEYKRPSESTWTNISVTSHILTAGSINNSETFQYRMKLSSCGATGVSGIHTVNVTTLASPPTPTNGDITTTCAAIIPIATSTSYAAGYTIRHHYYDWNGNWLSTQTATTPFTSTVYYSQYTPGTFVSPKTFYVEAEVDDGIGGCPNQVSGRKSFTYTVGSFPQPPSDIDVYQGANQITTLNVCPGAAIQVTAVNATTNYKWYNALGSLIGTGSTLNYTPQIAGGDGTYYITGDWTSPCGGNTQLQGTFVIDISNVGIPTFGETTQYCGVTKVTPSPSLVSWYWLPNATTFVETDTAPYKIVSNNSTVYLGVKGQFDCWGVANQVVTIVSQGPTVTVSPTSVSLCNAGSVTLTASGADFYIWHDNAGNIMQSSPNLTTPPLNVSTTFMVSGYNLNGCMSDVSRTINVWTQETVTPQRPMLTFDGVQYSAQSNNTDNSPVGISYYWQNTPDGTSTASFAEPRQFITGGIYYMRARNSNGCWGPSSSIGVPNLSGPTYPSPLANSTMNFVRIYKYTDSEMPTVDPDLLTLDKVNVMTEYLDGLGRSLQKVGKGQSPDGYDLVTPIDYDVFGRKSQEFLPYAASTVTGNVQGQPFTTQAMFYQNTADVPSSNHPFSATSFEPSPLQRVVEQGAPGTSWQVASEHTLKKRYAMNVTNEVYLFKVDDTGNVTMATLPADRYYPPDQLLANRSLDEENHEVIEYIDKRNRVVCKKVNMSSTNYASTYYLYDDFGNLAVVIPPEGVDRIVNGN